jgi:hypothetical protein
MIMQLELSGAQVRCPHCGEIYYQTTALYDPKTILTGSMLEWIPKYGEQGYNWSLPFQAYDLSAAVICEGCGGPLAPSGFLGLDRLYFPSGTSPEEMSEKALEIKVPKKSKKAQAKEKEADIPASLFPMCEMTLGDAEEQTA